MKNKITQLTCRILLVVAVLFGVLQSQAQDKKFKYTDSWGKEGFSLESKSTSGVSLNFSINEFSMTNNVIDGEVMQNIQLFGSFLPNDAGYPDLPGNGRFIAIPQGSKPVLKVVSYRTETIKNVNMAPAFVIPHESYKETLIYEKNKEVYSKNAFYPAQPVIMSQPSVIRGVDVVTLGVTPFQYNPVTKELIVYKDLKVSVTFEGGNGHYGDDSFRNRWFDPILEDAILNYDQLPKIDYDKRVQEWNNEKITGCEYLIIIPNNPEFAQWADSVKKFRTEQGILTEIVKLQDIPNSTTYAGIKTYVDYAYNNWTPRPVACLLMADYGSNPASTITAKLYPDSGYPDFACDNYYADVVGSDELPDIIFARITANNAAQLQVMVTKFLNYERNPPTDAAFYNNPITALGWQDDRWFQIGSEVVGGFLKNTLGKNPVRINALGSPAGNTGNNVPGAGTWSTATNTATVLSYFGPSGLNYIPAAPGTLGGFSGGTPTGVVNALNSGSFMLQHRDHGGYDGWGEPAFVNSHINSLTNVNNKLSFIFSINCETGAYHNPSGCPTECFTEKFHRYTYGGQNSGALGLVAAAEVSYSFVNDTYIWGMYDNMWPNFMPAYGTTPASRDLRPAFGSAGGKYFLYQSSWPYNTSNKAVTYELFHMHGDAFQWMYSEVPQNLAITHNPTIIAGSTSFTITANAGAFIALTANGTILGTGTGTGSPQTITIPAQVPPTQIVVTVTKQNYFRYRSLVTVIAGTTPYLVLNTYTPTASPNYGTSIGLNVTLQNVATNPYNATGVTATLSTTNTNVSVTQNSANFGTINAGASVLVNNAFTVAINNNIPDQTNVNFNIHSSGTYNSTVYTWDSPLNMITNAPVMSIGNMTINDAAGNNNGRLDPGENVILTIPSSNTGHANATGAVGTLTCTNPNITITNGTNNIGVINAGATTNPTFNVSISAGATIGSSVSFHYVLAAGAYQATRDIVQSIGLIVEDWETNTFTKFPWQNPAPSWTLVGGGAQYEGNYTAKSATITHSQNTFFSISYGVATNDSIKFYKKVSSESGYDYLKFYIDATETGSWSGTSDVWSLAKYPVTAGSHIFKWTYLKDGSVNSGSDCAWVDYILLPAGSPDGINNYEASLKGVTLICYPNPFNETTTLSYSLNKASKVSLVVYNSYGKEISTLVNGSKQLEGSHNVVFDGSKLSAGIYYCVLKIDSKVITKKLTVTK